MACSLNDWVVLLLAYLPHSLRGHILLEAFVCNLGDNLMFGYRDVLFYTGGLHNMYAEVILARQT